MARSIAEIEADLADVREAIKQALTMQSYADGDTKVWRPSLESLQARETKLEDELTAAQNAAACAAGGITFNTGRIAR